MIGRLAALLMLAAVACGGGSDPPAEAPASPGGAEAAALTLVSPAFEEGEAIPDVYSCRGSNVSPPLEWTGVPDGAVELVLTLQDPDAPGRTFTHWTVFGIEPSVDGSDEGGVPEGGIEGANDVGGAGYGGPCPPPGPAHRYVFSLMVLDVPSGLEAGAAPDAVVEATTDAVATATLTGLYPG